MMYESVLSDETESTGFGTKFLSKIFSHFYFENFFTIILQLKQKVPVL